MRHGDHTGWKEDDCYARHCNSKVCVEYRLRDGGSCACNCADCLIVSTCVIGKTKLPQRSVGDQQMALMRDVCRLAHKWGHVSEETERGNREDEKRLGYAEQDLAHAVDRLNTLCPTWDGES